VLAACRRVCVQVAVELALLVEHIRVFVEPELLDPQMDATPETGRLEHGDGLVGVTQLRLSGIYSMVEVAAQASSSDRGKLGAFGGEFHALADQLVPMLPVVGELLVVGVVGLAELLVAGGVAWEVEPAELFACREQGAQLVVG
jgi:hypothetical protein